ncbi:MAG: tetratricopeptide repeat protein, partial [Candidatus Cloacimonetes bacterium]|nr:tetratricopeptide repeat protein [Candidatus Cloacimonadota bacterium]
IQLLKARCLTGLNQIEESIALFETVITANQNTAISAEASYYLAELYFITLQDYEKAIEYYNNVKKEYNRSEFVEDSVSRSSVASQILQYNNPDYTIPVEDLVNQQFKLAEFYIEVLDNPDSALAVYNNIILQEHLLKDRLDSLRYVLANFSEPDYPVYIEDIQPDSLTIFIDSLDTVADTVKTLSREDITNQISRLENSIIQYKNDFIPMAHFIKIWLYVNSYQDTTSAYQEFTVLKSESPQSRYTFASDRLLQGEQAELITYTQKKNREEYENAISWLERDPIIALSKLDSIITQSQHEYFNKALYTAGYISYFLLADTTRARDYLDNLLANRPEQEMVQAVNKFYNDGDFIALSRVELLSDEKTVPEIPDTTKDQKPEEKVLPVPETKEELAEPEKELLLEADEPVEILKREKMIIPDFFKRDFEVIDIELAVDKEGKLNALSIINPAAADSTLLRRILQNNIQKWQFKPAQKDGEPVDAKLLLPLDLSNE